MNFKMEHGICLQTWQQERASTGDDRGTSCFFSSCGGILELQRRTQGASRVPLGKSNLHSSSEGELGIALESLQGNKTSSGVVSRNSMFVSSDNKCWEPAYFLLSAYCILSAALTTASSFRIWNSSTGILSLPGASVRNSTRGKGHEEGGLAYAKVGSSLRSPPGNSRASTPKTRVCLLSALCFHLHL